MTRSSRPTLLVFGVLATYLGLQGIDYYRLRNEKQLWSNLLEERIGQKSMKPTEDLKFVRFILSKEGKEPFYDYARDLFKYLDYEIKEVSPLPGEAYTYLRDHMTDCDGLVVVGRHLFNELIDAYMDCLSELSSSSENIKESDESSRSVGDKSMSRRYRWFSRFFSRINPFSSSSSSSTTRTKNELTSISMSDKPVLNKILLRMPILGYLPLRKDDPSRPWYSSLREHFCDIDEARTISHEAFMIAEGFSEVIDVATPYDPSNTVPLINFRHQLDDYYRSRRQSLTSNDEKPHEEYHSSGSFPIMMRTYSSHPSSCTSQESPS